MDLFNASGDGGDSRGNKGNIAVVSDETRLRMYNSKLGVPRSLASRQAKSIYISGELN